MEELIPVLIIAACVGICYIIFGKKKMETDPSPTFTQLEHRRLNSKK